MAIVGNTVTLRAEFPAEIGDLSEIIEVVVKIYTQDFRLLDTIPSGEVTKVSDGVYTAKYTITDKFMPDSILFEFSGELDNAIYLGRNEILRTYI